MCVVVDVEQIAVYLTNFFSNLFSSFLKKRKHRLLICRQVADKQLRCSYNVICSDTDQIEAPKMKYVINTDLPINIGARYKLLVQKRANKKCF